MRRSPRFLLAAFAASLAAACAVGTTDPDPMLGTLSAKLTTSGTTLTLAITNGGAAPVTLDFSSGQQYDFHVRRADGTGVWTWSADKGFIMAITHRTFAPGETVTFAADWPAAPPGAYSATGTLTSFPETLEATATVVVP